MRGAGGGANIEVGGAQGRGFQRLSNPTRVQKSFTFVSILVQSAWRLILPETHGSPWTWPCGPPDPALIFGRPGASPKAFSGGNRFLIDLFCNLRPPKLCMPSRPRGHLYSGNGDIHRGPIDGRSPGSRYPKLRDSAENALFSSILRSSAHQPREPLP